MPSSTRESAADIAKVLYPNQARRCPHQAPLAIATPPPVGGGWCLHRARPERALTSWPLPAYPRRLDPGGSPPSWPPAGLSPRRATTHQALSLCGVASCGQQTYMGLIDWTASGPGQTKPLSAPSVPARPGGWPPDRSGTARLNTTLLKCLLHCAVCGRRYSFLVATGNMARYLLYCRHRPPPIGCREPHTPRPACTPGQNCMTASSSPTTGLCAPSLPQGRDRRPPGPRRHERQQLDVNAGPDGERRKRWRLHADDIDRGRSATNRPNQPAATH